MIDRYMLIRGVAIALAACLWIYQTGLLIEHAGGLARISWLELFGTVAMTATLAAALILTEYCFRNWQIVKGLGLFALFVLLVAGTLPQVLARTGEARDAKVAEALHAPEARQLARDELARAQQRLREAEAEAKRESRAGGCKATCQNWQLRGREVQAHIDSLVAKLAQPDVAGPADTPRFASAFGIAPAAYNLYQPFAKPLAIEIGIWVLGWIGFAPSRHRPAPKVQPEAPAPKLVAETVSPKSLVAPEVQPVAVAKPEPEKTWTAPVVEAMSHDELAVLAALSRTKSPSVNNKTLAKLMGCSEPEASKRVGNLAGLVKKERVGGEVRISLNHAAMN